MQWFRKCQACGNVQTAVKPKGELTDSYRNSKCRRCKSEALDYGSSSDPRSPPADYTADE